jgi:hypothetical protein
MLLEIKSRYHNNINRAAVKVVHLLTRAEERSATSNIEPDKVKQMLYNNMKRLVHSNIIEQYETHEVMYVAPAAYQMNNGRFMTTAYEQINLDSSHLSIFQCWTARLAFTGTELLATIAMSMLAIKPSEASVERSVSQQKLTQSALRNRLADAVIEVQMFIKINAPLLTSNDSEWIKKIPNEWTTID